MAEQGENRPAILNGCSWGRETRVMVDNIRESVTEIKESIKGNGKKIDIMVEAAAGKPSWFVTGVISLLGMLCVGLITYIVTCPNPSTKSNEQETHLVSLSPKENQ